MNATVIHDTHVSGAARRGGRAGYQPWCSCGWSKRPLRSVGMATFETELHERVESMKASARAQATVDA